MCRMIGFVGPWSPSLDLVFNAFRAGSQCDPYVEAAFPGCTGHPHGWGFAAYDGQSLHHYRSSLPVWQDQAPLPDLSGQQVCALFHSRLASNPALDSPLCSHPFIASTDREVLVFAHNGGIRMDERLSGVMVDSEWALGEIVRRGGLNEALPALQERTTSALNLIVLVIPRDKKRQATLQCLNFYKPKEQPKKGYYAMFTADYAGGKLFLSSTFKDGLIPGLRNMREAEFGKLFCL
ncbi:MAG TPA: hypothetical protein VMU04_14265 [Candidatus Acidoferrum sp.]|nr:hypothetical protein [Candidatus Acidoferrum sp.]